MLTVNQLMQNKPTNFVWAVRPDQMVIEAVELMADKNIGAVLVMDGEKLVGIFSERDYARRGLIQGRKAQQTPISEVMTPNVITVSPRQKIEDCMQVMSDKKFRHLPVVDNGQVMGVISISDLVTAIMREQQNRIQSLEDYISNY